MRVPHIKASSGQLIELAWFAICAVEADDETKGLEADLKTARAGLKKGLGKRNDAADELVKTRALRKMAFFKTSAWLKQLGLDATAAFGGKKQSPDYLRILPTSPSRLMQQNQADRMESLGKVLKALAHPATPAVLKAALEKGAALVAALVQREAEVAAARDVLSDRIEDIDAARRAWFLAYRTLPAALTMKFPNDRDRVDAYFDDPPTASAKAAAQDPQSPEKAPE